MFRNYMKIAWRNLNKYRFYSLLNIFGLSIGILFSLLTFGFVWRVLQVNKNLKNVDRQYIITSNWKRPNMGNSFTSLGQLAKGLKERYPNLVENYYRFDGITTNVSHGNKVFREDFQIGDSSFLSMFGFKLQDGNAQTVFSEPFSIVLSSKAANKYFGKTNVVGQTLEIQNFAGQKHPFKITGVLAAIEPNSVTNFLSSNACDFYTSISDLSYFNRNMDWKNSSIASYIELKAGVDPTSLNVPMQQLISKNSGEDVAKNLVSKLEPLSSYYLNSGDGNNRKMLFAIITIASFILLMAIVNFVNLSISRSSSRMKEIGLRKILGSQKKQLIFQFLSESYLLVIVSTIIGLLLYVITAKLFSQLVGKDIPALWRYPFYTIAYLILFVFIIGLLAGLYPAFILSSFNPVSTLKSKWSTSTESKYLRIGLIVVQFVITTIVLVNVWIVGRQVSFLLHSNLGFDKDYVITAQLPRDWSKNGVQKMESFRQQFLNLPSIKDVSLSFEIPNGNTGGSIPVYKLGTDSSSAISLTNLITDANFLSTYQIPIVAGRFFEKAIQDSGNIVLNETAIHALGWKDSRDAIGQQVKVINDPAVFTIKGITKDFNFGPLQSKIPPIAFLNVENINVYRYFSFKLGVGSSVNNIQQIEQKWRELMPDAAFEYQFMDDVLKQLYVKEIQFRNAAYIALVLSLFMVIMGIVGLISLSVQKRVKEVAVRKVLGASSKDIIRSFIKEYTWILLLGNIIALPIAFYIGRHWLDNYAYHIPLSIVPFLIAIGVVALFTLSIIVLQTYKVAIANPVKNLRTE